MKAFFGYRKSEKKKYHCASWRNLSNPMEEGWLGMKNLKDVCVAFKYKHWWNIRVKNTSWGEFIKAKYFQRTNPKCKKWVFGDSLNFKHMIHNRIKVEQHIH